MKRTNISREYSDESLIIEFDEDYQAGRKINVKSHYLHQLVSFIGFLEKPVVEMLH